MAIPLINPTPPPPTKWLKYLDDSYASNHFCNFGPAHQLFQRALQARLKTQHLPVLCCNATLALETVLLAAELSQCDILVPSFTFVATASAVERVGSRPILVDSDPYTWHMCLQSAEKMLTNKTRAMVVVHPLGMVVSSEPFADFANKHGLALIFDSAAAFGAAYPSKQPDETGLCEVFSFHVTKSLGIGEGGAIVANSSSFLEKCRKITNFGLNENAQADLLGTNAKMSDFQAAIGLAALDTADETMSYRQNLGFRYLDKLKEVSHVTLQYDEDSIIQHSFPVLPLMYKKDPEILTRVLDIIGVGYRQYYKPLHLHPRYSKKKRNSSDRFPVATNLAQTVFCLPSHTRVSIRDVDLICKALENA